MKQQRTGTFQICPFSTFRFSVYYKIAVRHKNQTRRGKQSFTFSFLSLTSPWFAKHVKSDREEVYFHDHAIVNPFFGQIDKIRLILACFIENEPLSVPIVSKLKDKMSLSPITIHDPSPAEIQVDYTIQNIRTETKHQQHSTLQHPASQRQQNPNLEHASSPSHPAIPLSEPKSPLSTRKIKIGGTERRAKNNSQSDEISSERKKRNEAHAPLRTYGCANGPKCLMALDKAAQDPSFITGFCVHCRHKIHDRCGGRQEGDEPLICLQCKSKWKR